MNAGNTTAPRLASARRVVVKIGSALLVDPDSGRLHRPWLDGLAGDIKAMKARGQEVLIVSSGAIALGVGYLGLKARRLTLEHSQAAAAVGQIRLAHAYEESLAHHRITVAQILLTPSDTEERRRYLNARGTITSLLALGVVPVINENDTVVTDEIRFGDNDTLAALAANLVEADHLILLTDQAGLYERDPREHPDARLISEANAADTELDAMATGSGGVLGRGGMATKIRAARLAARSGTCTLIAPGREADVLLRLRRGEELGTLLKANQAPIAAHKQWLAGQLQLKGRLTCDSGAVRALREQGSSLLPVGVKAVEGGFRRGEVVACVDEAGHEIARGLVNYDANEVRRILGQPSNRIEAILGYVAESELIHRDDMVVF